MKTKKIYFGIIGTVLLLLPLVTACVSGSGTQEANPTQGSTMEATKPQANEVLKLGFAMDLTGPGAEWFVPFANILEMEIDRINKEGGVEVAGKKYDLKLIKYTTNLTAEGAKAAAEKLVYQDGVKIMWGAGILDETMALQDVTMPNKVLNFSAGFGQETLSGKLVDGKIVNPYKYTIAIVATSYESSPGMWKWVKANYPDYKRVATITIDTVASHWAVEQVEAKALSKLGFVPAIQEYYETGQTDFYGILTKVLQEEPDIIHCTNSPPNEWALIMKQAREMGFKGIFFREEMASQNIIDIAGADNVEGLLGWDYPVMLPEYQDLIKRYTERYGRWDSYAPIAIRMLPVLIQAMQKAGTVDDVDKILSTILAGKWKTYGQDMQFCGQEYYGVPNFAVSPLTITQFRAGKFVPVGTISNDDQCTFWQ